MLTNIDLAVYKRNGRRKTSMNVQFFRGSSNDSLKKIDIIDLENKINLAIFMLKKGDVDELKPLLKPIDIDALANLISKIDKSDIQSLNIDINEIKNRLTNSDLEKLTKILGKRGIDVVKKIKELLSMDKK